MSFYRKCVGTLVATGLTILAGFTGEYLQGATGLRHTRVLWQENPAEEATISWTHDVLDANSLVHFDEVNPGSDPEGFSFHQRVNYAKAYSKGGKYSYHTLLRGLKPSTPYYFMIESGGRRSPVAYFVTAPSDERRFKLLFGGDSRSQRDDRLLMNKLMQQLFSHDPDILALVHGGDYVADGGNWQLWEEWLDDHQLTTSEGRLLPIVAARGNHEIDARLFNEIFSFPGGGQVYYATKIANFALLNLNTEISVSGDQKVWLEKTLKELSVSHKWLTVNYHQPAWPAVKIPSGALQHWVPTFEKYLVDLAFESDGHTLKRTVPIRGGKRDDAYGVIYVGEGGLGVKQREPKNADAWYLQAPGYATASHHVQVLTVDANLLHYQVVLKDGRLFEDFSLQPRQRKVEDKKEPEVNQPMRLYNTETDSCLYFDPAYKEDLAVHGPCSGSDLELFAIAKVGDQYYQVKHLATGTCLTFTEEWLFMGHDKAMLKPCDKGNSKQWLNFQRADFVDWQILDRSKQRCLHFSQFFRNSDAKHQAFHTTCGPYLGKERIRFQGEGTSP